MLKRLFSVTMLVLLLSTNFVFGQDSLRVIQPLAETKRKPLNFILWGYGMGAKSKCANLWTANNPSYSSKDLFYTHWDLGVCFSIVSSPKHSSDKSNSGFTRSDVVNLFYTRYITLGLGYRHESYAFQTSKQGNYPQGIINHRFTCEASVKYMLFTVGLTTDFLLKSSYKDVGVFSNVGLNDDCFNRTSLRWYVGLYFPVSFLELEGRFGSYIVPTLNTNKFAYYNMNKGIWYGEFWELRIAFRLFTTGNKLIN